MQTLAIARRAGVRSYIFARPCTRRQRRTDRRGHTPVSVRRAPRGHGRTIAPVRSLHVSRRTVSSTRDWRRSWPLLAAVLPQLQYSEGSYLPRPCRSGSLASVWLSRRRNMARCEHNLPLNIQMTSATGLSSRWRVLIRLQTWTRSMPQP